MDRITAFAGRLLMAPMFLLSGVDKILNYSNTQSFMEQFQVPGLLLPAVVALEIGAALALFAGWQTRTAASALAVFCLLAALIFHTNFADTVQMIMFMKNITITGGLLMLVAHGAGAYSVDEYLHARPAHAA